MCTLSLVHVHFFHLSICLLCSIGCLLADVTAILNTWTCSKSILHIVSLHIIGMHARIGCSHVHVDITAVFNVCSCSNCCILNSDSLHIIGTYVTILKVTFSQTHVARTRTVAVQCCVVQLQCCTMCVGPSRNGTTVLEFGCGALGRTHPLFQNMGICRRVTHRRNQGRRQAASERERESGRF